MLHPALTTTSGSSARGGFKWMRVARPQWSIAMNGKFILSALLALSAAPVAQAADSTYYCLVHNEDGQIVNAASAKGQLFVIKAATLDKAKDAALAAGKKKDAKAESAECSTSADSFMHP